MLISPFHFPMIDGNHPAYRVLITNLETVALSFRVHVTLATGTDEDRLPIVTAYLTLDGFTSVSGSWVRAKPDLYTRSATVAVKPGRTVDVALRANDQTGALGYLWNTNGHAEIFLPPVASQAGPVAALDHPAHIMLAAMHVVGDKGR